MTKEEFLKIIPEDYELVGEFINKSTPTEFIHKPCGTKVVKTPNALLAAGKCDVCRRNEAKAKVQAHLDEIGGDFEILTFNIFKGYADIVHHTCGTHFQMYPENMLKATKDKPINCPKCNKSHCSRKFSKEDIIERLSKERPDVELIGEYNGYKVLSRFRCKKCGTEFDATARNVLEKGRMCDKCKLSSISDIKKEEVEKASCGEFELLEYNGRYNRSKFLHKKCGHTFEQLVRQFFAGNMNCPHCGKHRITEEEFVQKLKDVHGDDYEYLEGLTGAHNKVAVKHNKCGHIFYPSPSNILRGHGCPYCANNIIKTTEEFKEVVGEISDGYEVLGEYKGAKRKIKMVHKCCPSNSGDDFEFFMAPADFKNGQRCPKCGGTMLKDTVTFKQEVFDLVGDEYTVLEEYKNAHTKILMRHNKCGSKYLVRPGDFLFSNIRCPICNESHGEIAIRKILTDMHIVFESQYRIPECKNIRSLPFDFAILDANNNLVALIEYDGAQHHVAVERWGGEENLKNVQNNDRLKTEYCEKNGIPLLRIPYWDYDNVENLVREFVVKLNKKAR